MRSISLLSIFILNFGSAFHLRSKNLEHWPSGKMGMTAALFATFICAVNQRRQHFGQNLQLSF
jgi:hypothetical protein